VDFSNKHFRSDIGIKWCYWKSPLVFICI
jgi:hypothetical protein